MNNKKKKTHRYREQTSGYLLEREQYMGRRLRGINY